MACAESTDLPSSTLVTQQTVPLDVAEPEGKNDSSASGISSLKEGEHKDGEDCLCATKKKKRKKRKKKKESPTPMHDDSETVTAQLSITYVEEMKEIVPDSDYVDQTCAPDRNEKKQEKHQCSPPEYSQPTIMEGIAGKPRTDYEQRPVDLKQAIKPDGDNSNIGLEHVVTEEGRSSQATTTANEPCFGEKDHFGLAVQKKKTKKKKKKKAKQKDEHRTQEDQGSAIIPGEEPNIDTEDMLTVSQVQKEKETVRVFAVDSKAQTEKELGDVSTAPCGSGDTEQNSDDICSEVADAKKECTVEVAHNVLQDCKGSVQDIAEGAHGVTTSEKDESKTGDDHVSTSMRPQEELYSVAKDNSSTTTCHEGRNILCIFKLIYGVGLRALRKLFMEIHPSWSNVPGDAAGLDKGAMKLGKEEECSFNTGNINEWDFSLITSVLLFSKRCALEISKRAHHEDSLRDLKVYRNKLLGHPSNDKMSDSDFNSFWPNLHSNFVTLGASPDEIAEIKVQSDEVLHSGDYYRNLFLKEQKKEFRCEKKLDEVNSKLDAIMAHQVGSDVAKTPLNPKDLSGATWDEWLKFRDAFGDFKANQNQYILVADAMSPEDLDCFSRLRSVSWKMILDFDPMSEEKGFYWKFTSAEGQSNLVNMFTPAELGRSTMGNLIRQIDCNKIQWLFVNGRFSDTDGSSQTFSDWEANSVKHISRFLGCCSDPDKFDKQKPVVCLILPFCEQNVPHLEVTLSRLLENFNEFNLEFISFKHQHCHRVPRKCRVRNFDLSPKLVNLGLKEMLCTSTTQEYRMPTSHAGLPAKLSQNEYLYLKEHLQILYDGCEDLPEPTDDPAETDKELKDFFEEHRRSFISGNQISFVSLYDNHDAKREIETDIRIHIQRVLDQGLTRSLIVEIRHSPGTGGTTIARRVMWDLSKGYPCAFVEVSSPHYFDEENIIADKLVKRILAMEEICHTTPVILIDGKQSGVTEGFSNKLVRMLCNTGKRALLLRCLHGAKPSKTQESSHVHHVFNVNVKLEDSIADLREFRLKYNEYLEESLGRKSSPDLCRVFHFPLLAMMEEFRPKLRKIIDDTLSEMGGLQQEIAVVVAFLQKYANHATPALLLYEAFKEYIRVAEKKCASYEDIARELFTGHLLNLMVPTNPLRRLGRSDRFKELPPESYTLQHHLVADLVLRKVFREQHRNLFDVVRKFLQFPIYQHERFLSLFQELFAYNKFGRKLKFSILFEDLKRINSEHAAEVFCDAAEKTNDPVIYTNAARFLAKKDPPSFSQAKQLIRRAFNSLTNSPCHFRPRVLCHSKGVVLFSELKHIIHSGKVKDLEKLEELASSVLEAYHEARNFPPTYPHPLIGEVEVWLTSIDWIMRNICGGDSDETLRFLTKQSPPFFRTCVSDSFHLLDVVDRIVQSVPDLTDPEETQRRCNSARLSLMSIFRRRFSRTGRGKDSEDLVQACEALCTAKNFPKSSQLELKKLQAQFFLNSGVQIDSLEQEKLGYVLRLLEELVVVENEYRFAYHLMKVCVLVTGPRCFTLEQGLNVSEKWVEMSHHDCLPYFYQMAIYFLKILDGYSVEVMPHYKKAWKTCRDKSKNNLRSTQSTLFVGKEGRGMSRLTTRSTLFHGENDYSTDDSEKVKNFWLVDSRKKLLECKGRIRMGQSSGRGKSHPYIELLQGNVELYVGKTSDIGKVEMDFTPGTLAYFVVSFNLQGPVANGISLSPQHPSHQ